VGEREEAKKKRERKRGVLSAPLDDERRGGFTR